jgi:hypothetical protein
LNRFLGGVALLVLAFGFGAGFASFGRRGSEARLACEASGGRMIYPMATLGAVVSGTVPPPVCAPGTGDG